MDPNQNEPGESGADPAAAAAGAGGAPAGSEGGAFAAADSAASATGGEDGSAAPLAERIPEKYRVAKEDGSLDIEASTAKLLDGHTALEKRFGAGEAPPKAPEDYKPEVEGFDFEELKGDEKYQSFLKGAHARGINNDTLSWILGEYATRAGDDVGGGVMSTAEFKAEMQANHWTTPAEYQENMALGLKAIRAYAPDITAEELAGIPNSPTVAKILAAVGKEVGEDRQVQTQALSAADFDTQLAALQASEAYNNASHPEHQQSVAKMQELFDKRYAKPG